MCPEVSRRQFLKAAGVSAVGAVVFTACGFPKSEIRVASPARMPEDLVTGTDNWYATLCRQCPAGCGIIVRVMEGRAKKIEGNPLYPINTGKLCARGQAGLQALYHPDRIRQPLQRDRATGVFHEVSWNEGMDVLASSLQELRTTPDSVVLATGPLRGHLQALVTRFLGSYSWPSRDGALHLTHEPLESAPLRQAWSMTVRQPTGLLPDYDIARASYILSFGADFLSADLSPVRYSAAYGEFRQGDRPRGTLVQVDPRFSLTAANADRWIPVVPGTEGVLALSMAYVMLAEGLADRAAADAMTGGRGTAALEDFRPDRASGITGVSPQTIATTAHEFASQRPSLAIGGGPAAAHTNGTFNMTAVFALNFLVGSVGAPGGLVANPPLVAGNLPVPYGGSPLRNWQALVQRLQSGQPRPVQLVLVRGTNPVYSLPASIRFREALQQAPMVVSISSFMDETASMADLILPEHNYLEDWGNDIPDPGPGYQVVGFQQPVVAPVHDTRAFADILLEVGRRIGAPVDPPPDLTLPWDTFRDLLREGVGQLQELRRGSVTDANPEAFWNKVLQQGGWWDASVKHGSSPPVPPRLPGQGILPRFDGDPGRYPLSLIPFPSHSLGDGRGAYLPWLQATPDPVTTVGWQTWVEVGRSLAREADLQEGDVVSVESSQGAIEAWIYVNPALPPGVVAVPMGQGHAGSDSYATGRGSNVFSILAPLEDETTGALAWAATRVRLVKTGRRRRMPKFEGTMFPAQVAGSEVVEVVH